MAIIAWSQAVTTDTSGLSMAHTPKAGWNPMVSSESNGSFFSSLSTRFRRSAVRQQQREIVAAQVAGYAAVLTGDLPDT